MSFLTDKYSKMLKVGHPKEVVLQIIGVDLQCSKDHPKFPSIMNWVDKVSNGGSLNPIPSEFSELAKSKYQRMAQNGISGDHIYYVKTIDTYAKQMRKQTGNSPVYEYAREVSSLGNPLHDRVVNEKDISSLVEVTNNSSHKRASDLKKEAISIREDYVSVSLKSAVENITDEHDSAPLIVPSSKASQKIILEKEQFHDYKDPCYPEPEVKREEVINLLGLSNEVRPVVFREHIPQRMFSFLNVLTPNECIKLIRKLDFTKQEQKVQEHLITTAINSKQEITRTNIRRNFIDDEIAKMVWRVIKSTLPAVLSDGRKLSGVRSKMNYYRYGEDQFFKTHIDGGFRFTETGDTSEYTFVIYLNDDFKGGTTRCCPLSEWNNEIREVMPREGGMLIFRQEDMKHCGVTVIQGFKHILQGMVMYGPIKYNNLGKPFGKTPQFFIPTTCDCE